MEPWGRARPRANAPGAVNLGGARTRRSEMTQADPTQLQAELAAAEEILRTATLARLAYDGIDGTPRVIPIGFLWTGRAVVVATHPTAPKFTALRILPSMR